MLAGLLHDCRKGGDRTAALDDPQDRALLLRKAFRLDLCDLVVDGFQLGSDGELPLA